MRSLMLGMAITVAGLVFAVAPAQAESFSFGDFFFAGQTAANGFSSVTDQATPYSASGPGAGFTFLQQGGSGADGWAGDFKPDVLVLYDDGASGAVTIAFSSPVDSITGLAAEPKLGGAYTATLTAFDGGALLGSSSYSSVSGKGEGTISYFDFSAPGITSIVISTTNDSGGIGIGSDNPGIPEPASWALMLLGFGAVGGGMRARRRRAVFAPA